MPLIFDRVRDIARVYGDKTAIDFEGRTLTYAQLLNETLRYADHLSTAGVGAGRRVCLLLDNGVEFVALQLAIAKLGAVVVLIDYRLAVREIEFILNDIAPDAVVTDGAGRERLGAAGKSFSVHDVRSFAQPASSDAKALPQGSATDDYFVIYSSGSTGQPKGIVHSQRSLARIVDSWIQTIGLTAEDRLLCTLVFSHGHSQMIHVWPALFTGATLFLLDVNRLTPGRVLQHAIDHEISVFSNLPVFYELALRLPDGRFDISHLRYAFCGSAPMREDLGRKFFEKFRVKLCNLYGLTELGPSHVNLESPDSGSYASVGQCLVGMTCQTVDEERRRLPAGEVGEIRLRSDTFFKGYLNRPAATRDLMPGDGWLYSRDLGYLDEAGRLFVTGRKSDFVNISGNKVSPDEIEDVLKEHEAIRDAGVFGELSQTHGERLVAVYVSPQPIDEQTLRTFCRDHLASFKVPSRFVHAGILPRTSTGKLQKQKLKADFGQA